MVERLQKVLAAAGIGSRRSCEALIAAGRVAVNGTPVAALGAKADPAVDDIRVDGRPVRAHVEHVYLVLNKPLGYVSTVSDRHAEHTVMELVRDVPGRIYPVGRLDADSAGLLLMTNDGAFTERLTHPRHQVPRTYRVVARGEVPSWAAADLRQGIVLEDGMTAPAVVEWVDYDEANNATIVDVTIHEGRNRQVRRMFDAIGYPVLALTRTHIGPIRLKGLAPGRWRPLHPAEVKGLLAAADSTPAAPPSAPRPPKAARVPTEPEPPAPAAARRAPRPEALPRQAASGSGSPARGAARRPSENTGGRLRMTDDDARSAARDLAQRLGRETPEEKQAHKEKHRRGGHDSAARRKPAR